MRRGIGIIGAGPGASALHVPTIARLGEDFTVVHVADAGSGRAAEIAARAGASGSQGTQALLADPRVDAVVIASTPDHHAEHILQAVAAGVRGVLCEKPLATTHDDVEEVIAACRDADVALVVGTNHLYDPAWLRAKHHLVARGERIRDIALTVSLPPNDRYHAAVTEPSPSGRSSRPQPDWNNPAVAAAVVRQLVLGLAVHDIPLLRDLAPRIDRVLYARPLAPIGFMLGYRAGPVLVQVTMLMVPEGADALWRLVIGTEGDRIEIDFPPAFVHSGSAVVQVRHAEDRRSIYPHDDEDGYLGVWSAFRAQLELLEPVEYDEIAADAHFAVELADAAAAAVLEGDSV